MSTDIRERVAEVLDASMEIREGAYGEALVASENIYKQVDALLEAFPQLRMEPELEYAHSDMYGSSEHRYTDHARKGAEAVRTVYAGEWRVDV